MLFNSYEFIFFYLPIVIGGFFWISRNSYRLAALWLAAASVFFYGAWNPRFVLLLLASITVNYGMGYAIDHARLIYGSTGRAKCILAVALAGNLMLLGYFKYTNFFIETISQMAGTSFGMVEIVLPLGISFFTFTQIAFLVDAYRGIAREYNFIHYLLFVSYFPHLIAGPVLHHKQIMPQFDRSETYKPSIDNVNIGLTFFAIGLFKKVCLADQFALYANPIFDAANGGGVRLLEAWAGALAFTLQLYFDFSAYSDMAIGLSRMFNVKLPINFNSPYKATNIIEFWSRWHITLSAFLRDYLYIPLGGNRKGVARRYANLFATMLLGGLWHGANWTFVFWGGLHGVYLVINHGWQALCRRVALPRIPGSAFLARGLTFVAVVVAWVPFRASDFQTASNIMGAMAGLNGLGLPARFEDRFAALAAYGIRFDGAFPFEGLSAYEIAPWLAWGLAIAWTLPNTQQWVSKVESRNLMRQTSFRVAGMNLPPIAAPVSWGVALGLALGTALVMMAGGKSEFIYFNF